jgi:hypothetical protein
MANNPNHMENLTPYPKGVSGNTGNKGVKSLATRVKNILGNEKLLAAVIKSTKNKPEWLNDLDNKDIADVIVMAMAAKAMSGDTQAAAWIRKTGYGDMIDFTSDDKPIQPLYVFNFDKGIDAKSRSKPKAKRITRSNKE